jgi:hypothetical protein
VTDMVVDMVVIPEDGAREEEEEDMAMDIVLVWRSIACLIIL